MQNYSTKLLFTTSTIADGNMSFRIGDTEHSLKNRKQFLSKHDIDFEKHVCMKCDHGIQITPIVWSNLDRHAGAFTQRNMLASEVLMTQEKGLALMLLTADCLPVSFYDPVTETIALAHFSRETISKKLPQKTIKFFQESFTIDPANLLIQIGPHIHTNSYSFPLPQPEMNTVITPYIQKTNTNAHIDLVAACVHQLSTEGVMTGNIFISKIDTATSPNHFSHYQSKKKNTLDGRMATILMLR